MASETSFTHPQTATAYGAPITLERAKALAAAAQAEAANLGLMVSLTIVEPSGDLVLLQKMDQTQYGSVEIATKKAVTAARLRRSTRIMEEVVRSGVLISIFSGATAIEGGEIIVEDGKLIGAIGVSGGTPAQDGQVARAALNAL